MQLLRTEAALEYLAYSECFLFIFIQATRMQEWVYGIWVYKRD